MPGKIKAPPHRQSVCAKGLHALTDEIKGGHELERGRVLGRCRLSPEFRMARRDKTPRSGQVAPSAEEEELMKRHGMEPGKIKE